MPLTLRQQIAVTLTGGMYSAYDLAALHAISEREVEDHLIHIARSLARDTTRQIIRQPAQCEECEFIFRSRARFTRPSRCPKCHSERIYAPKFGIRLAL
jgi:predicted Zn-ribbon and HTH transcriptional regulator